MKCLICGGNSTYYFSKTYTEQPYKDMMETIGKVNYYRCENCGFVLSKTHSQLEKDQWEQLNKSFHTYLEDSSIKQIINQPPYIEQALMLSILSKHNIIDINSIIDYAAGYGTLSTILLDYFDIRLPIYDKYVNDDRDDRYVKCLSQYNTVINSAMFEHVLTREDLDEVNNLVSDNGCLILHTVVGETVPKDNSWFYLDPPVHTAFHTNKSMSLLMKQWNYEASLYCPDSKCWVLFKKDNSNIKEKVEQINREFQTEYSIFKKGFMNYWK
jgi:hypothetical protein